MSAKTDALEDAVTQLLQARTAAEADAGPRARAAVDRAFARLLRIAAPRIRHFIAQYGLTDMADDAEQVCAIALHRAVEAYDPAKSRFTTFVNWQLRGELQSLRFRVRTDQRSSAKRVAASTVSFEVLTSDDGTPFEQLIEDEDAEDRTASGAMRWLAERAAEAVVDGWIERARSLALRQAEARAPRGKVRRRAGEGSRDLPKFVQCRPGTIDPIELERIEARLDRDRAIVLRYLTGGEDSDGADDGASGPVTRERERQIVRRALREMAHAEAERAAKRSRSADVPATRATLLPGPAPVVRTATVEDITDEARTHPALRPGAIARRAGQPLH